MATPETDWIEWAGGECPVADNSPTEVKFGDGEVVFDTDPQGWDWGLYPNEPELGIIAYRVVSA